MGRAAVTGHYKRAAARPQLLSRSFVSRACPFDGQRSSTSLIELVPRQPGCSSGFLIDRAAAVVGQVATVDTTFGLARGPDAGVGVVGNLASLCRGCAAGEDRDSAGAVGGDFAFFECASTALPDDRARMPIVANLTPFHCRIAFRCHRHAGTGVAVNLAF